MVGKTVFYLRGAMNATFMGEHPFAADRFVGWQGALVTLILGSLAGSLIGGVLIASRRGTRHTALPFGSFLAPAGWVALLLGPALWEAYLRLFRG